MILKHFDDKYFDDKKISQIIKPTIKNIKENIEKKLITEINFLDEIKNIVYEAT